MFNLIGINDNIFIINETLMTKLYEKSDNNIINNNVEIKISMSMTHKQERKNVILKY